VRFASRGDLDPYLALAWSERRENEAVALPRFERDLAGGVGVLCRATDAPR
jgi:hypothetical protein